MGRTVTIDLREIRSNDKK